MILKFLVMLVPIQLGCSAMSEPKVGVKLNVNVNALGDKKGSLYGPQGTDNAFCQQVNQLGCAVPSVMDLCPHKCPQPDPEVCQYITVSRCSYPSVEALCPIKCIELDPKICEEINEDGCKDPSVMKLCPHKCPSPDPVECEFINEDSCIVPSVLALCPIKCPVVCDPECWNGAICTHGNTCICQPGWIGPQCNIDDCELECLNGGECIGGECSCGPFVRGPQCEEELVCEAPWVKLDGVGCFEFTIEEWEWETARRRCQAKGSDSDLAMLTDLWGQGQALKDHISTLGSTADDKAWWIGAFKLSGQWQWQWLDARPITGSFPCAMGSNCQSSNDVCLTTDVLRGYKSTACNAYRAYICQKTFINN